MLNIHDLVNFVLSYRKDSKAFKGYSKEQIFTVLCDAYAEKSIAVVLNQNETAIEGVCHGIRYDDQKIFHVSNCLTNGSFGVMKCFMEILNRLYPDYQLEGQRYGKIKHYRNTSKLKRRLTYK